MQRWAYGVMAGVVGIVSAAACSGHHDARPSGEAGGGCADRDGEACLVDGSAGADGEEEGNPDGSGKGTADAGADAAAGFVGPWAVSGTESFRCSSTQVGSEALAPTVVNFVPGPGETDSGRVDLLFSPAPSCSLAMFVSEGTARLVSAPVLCTFAGALDEFTSVEAWPDGDGGLALIETFNAPSGCSYEIVGELER